MIQRWPGSFPYRSRKQIIWNLSIRHFISAKSHIPKAVSRSPSVLTSCALDGRGICDMLIGICSVADGKGHGVKQPKGRDTEK